MLSVSLPWTSHYYYHEPVLLQWLYFIIYFSRIKLLSLPSVMRLLYMRTTPVVCVATLNSALLLSWAALQHWFHTVMLYSHTRLCSLSSVMSIVSLMRLFYTHTTPVVSLATLTFALSLSWAFFLQWFHTVMYFSHIQSVPFLLLCV